MEDKLSFMMETTKLRNILALASSYPMERDTSREQKMACIAKLPSMGVIHEIGELVGTKTLITVDLSSEHFLSKTERGNSWGIPCGYLLDDPQPLVESERKEDEYELNLERARQGDRQLMQKAIERGETADTLGQDSGKYNINVLYTPPPSFYVRSKDIVPDGWELIRSHLSFL